MQKQTVKKLLKAIVRGLVVLLFAILLETAVFNFKWLSELLTGQEAGPSYTLDDMKLVNWDKAPEGVLSLPDPMLVMEHVDSPVHVMEVTISASQEITNVQLFYTESQEEMFSGDKTIVYTNLTGNQFTLELNQTVSGIRLDLGEDAGLVLTGITVLIDPLTRFNFSIAHIVAVLLIYIFASSLNHLQKGPNYSQMLKKAKEEHGNATEHGSD